MNKSDIASALQHRIDWHKKMIEDCNAGVLLHFDTPEKRAKYIDEQDTRIAECYAIAQALHIKVNV